MISLDILMAPVFMTLQTIADSFDSPKLKDVVRALNSMLGATKHLLL